MTILDAIILGVVQGVTEFLPISSSGHLILVRDWFGFAPEGGLAFDAVLQLATACAILVYYMRDIASLVRGVFQRESRAIGEVVFLLMATIPAIILGLLLETYMETVFRSSLLVIGTLVAGALVMAAAEHMSVQTEKNLTWGRAVVVGFFQSLALVPGMSRSGMTIAGGLFVGLSRESAMRFAFLLGVPILLGSGGKKLADIMAGVEPGVSLVPLLAGSVAAFLVGLVVMHYLLHYLRTHTLMIFVWYRLGLAAILAAALLL